MEKPLSLKITEFKKNLLDTINNSSLPIEIIQLVVNEVKNAIDIEANRNYTNQVIEYNKQLQKEKAKESKETKK